MKVWNTGPCGRCWEVSLFYVCLSSGNSICRENKIEVVKEEKSNFKVPGMDQWENVTASDQTGKGFMKNRFKVGSKRWYQTCDFEFMM